MVVSNASSQDRLVYLDFAAATPVAPEVMEAMEPYWTERFYNPSAPYRAAREAHKDLEAARSRLAHVLGSRAGNVTLTAGATEANNLALAAVDGLAIVCATEHESVLACAEAHGSRVVGVTSDATLKLDELRALLDDRVELVSVGLANGEVGTIEPIREVARIVQDERMRRLEAGIDTPLFLHTDASQAAGHVSVNVSSLGVDLMTLSAAKVYGPKQVGLLWHADGIALRPLVRGGGQEGGVRSGTENVAGAVGFACALELAERMRAAEGKRLRLLARRFRSRLMEDIPDVVFAGPARDAKRLPGIVHASFAGVEARRLVIALERRGVCVGTGSACAASRMRTSHVLRAMGYPDELAQGSLRISMGRTTTEDEVDYAARTIVECVGAERARMGWRRPSPEASSAVVVGAVQTHASMTVTPVSVAGAGRERSSTEVTPDLVAGAGQTHKSTTVAPESVAGAGREHANPTVAPDSVANDGQEHTHTGRER